MDWRNGIAFFTTNTVTAPLHTQWRHTPQLNHILAFHTLSTQVHSCHASNTPFCIDHSSTNSTHVCDPDTPSLNITCLNHVLSISPSTRTAINDPNVAFDALLAEMLKQSLMSPVVREFPGIIVGGGFSGAKGEGACWKE